MLPVGRYHERAQRDVSVTASNIQVVQVFSLFLQCQSDSAGYIVIAK